MESDKSSDFAHYLKFQFEVFTTQKKKYLGAIDFN